MAKISAGILLYRKERENVEVFLAHPGGPFFTKKDNGSWSIPKGEAEDGEEADLELAKREFKEEIGVKIPSELEYLTEVKNKSEKIVKVWLGLAPSDLKFVKSNTFELEWPPKSGRKQEFSEVDRAEFFSLDIAQDKILGYQQPLLEVLAGKLNIKLPEKPEQVSLL